MLSDECKRLCLTYPDKTHHVQNKETEVVSAWESLLTKTKARKDKLVEAGQLQKLLNNFRDLMRLGVKRGLENVHLHSTNNCVM